MTRLHLLPNLEILDLHGTSITDAGLEHLVIFFIYLSWYLFTIILNNK